MSQPQYPTMPTVDQTTMISGLEFPDPYRGLEKNTTTVQQWQKAQNQLADDYVQSWPHYESLKESVAHHLIGINAVPLFVAGQWFRAGQEVATLENTASRSGVLMSDTPYGDGRLIFDINSNFDISSKSADGTPVLTWMSPSPDGKLLAVGICTDGSENNTIQLINITTGQYLPNPPTQGLMDSWTGGANWLPDSSGFYFLALQGPLEEFNQSVLFHSIVEGCQTPVELPLPKPGSKDYIQITVSPDGRYHIAHQGIADPLPIALLDTRHTRPVWRPFITDMDGSVAGCLIKDDRLIAVTNVDAPRGRVVSIAFDSTCPNDSKEWTELVAESQAVIRSITLVADLLYISDFVDTYSQVRIVDFQGNLLGKVPLPERGVVVEPIFPLQRLILKPHLDEYVFSFSTLVQSSGVYSHCPSSMDSIKTVLEPKLSIENAIIEDHWAISDDGTRIPYHCVRLASTFSSTPQPALLCGYGSSGFTLAPGYPAAMAAFIAAGGIYVHCHLRGGSEFGLDWAKGGRWHNKENGYKDLYAIAEDLINNHRTTAKQLALNGRSFGGLMSSVALTQRPDLWAVVVPQVPIIDLVGACRHPYGRWCIELELGNPEDPETIKRVAAFSPYYQVRKGEKYPAVFIDAGETDPRCPPWHAQKLAARLQRANAADTPILLRVWENSGHGYVNARSMQIAQYTAWLAFVMCQLGMEP